MQNDYSYSTNGLSAVIKKIEHFGYVLTDERGYPRYWSTTWTILQGAGLAFGTLKKQLSHIDDFYKHVDAQSTKKKLDDIIGDQDFFSLECALESYFVSLRNVANVKSSATSRWQTNLRFCRDLFERLSRGDSASIRFSDLTARLDRLDRLYGQLRPPKAKTQQFIRALPALVLEELYSNVMPNAQNNPFVDKATQWRAYMVFLLLLHQGLRRGEALSLRVDFLKYERTRSGIKYWLNVQLNDFDKENRYSTPSIKTANSVRQIPVSAATAGSFLAYIENYRGKQSHPFFLSSAKNRPLSAEGVNHIFNVLSKSLSGEAMALLKFRTSMQSVSPHDLRHTSAVIRMKQLLQRGDSMDEALQKMRSFFGWSRESSMPQLYAKAAFEERLAEFWSEEFDNRTAMLLALPE